MSHKYVSYEKKSLTRTPDGPTTVVTFDIAAGSVPAPSATSGKRINLERKKVQFKSV